MPGKLRRAALCASLAGAVAATALATAVVTPAAATAAVAQSLTSAATPDMLAARNRPDLQRELESLVHIPGGPPGAIVTFERDEHSTVYRAGYGDVATGRRPSPDDAMRIASVAKAYSGAVALLLVQKHELGLDDTIARRLPRLPRAWGRVTLRELLQHTSGLPDYSASPVFQAVVRADPHHVFDPHHLLDYVRRQPLLFPPGSRYKYSNSDNIAVALMAEAATGLSYDELLHCLVLGPLGLRHTSLPLGYQLPTPYLHGYDVPLSGPPEDVSTVLSASGAWASGGIVATPNDLNTFIEAYGGPELLSPRVRRAQLAFIPGASEPAGPGDNSVGLAIFRYRTRCGTVYGHTGNTLGYTQFAAASPDGKRSITFSINRQVTATSDPAFLAELRAVQEDFVCALLRQ
jgi:D-alanyl-D-alanine carboxypeptidase